MNDFRLISKGKTFLDVLREEGVGLKDAEYRKQYEGEFPPPDARTFADHDLPAARRIVERRPHVFIRSDPMFGRRGYAKEVLADPAAPGGFVVLVIAFATARNERGEWREPHRPKDHDRAYWPPGRVEFAAP